MPTFYKPGQRKGNRTVVVRGRINGRQYEITTPAINKGAAQDYWDEWKRRVRERERDQPEPGQATFTDAMTAYRAFADPNRAEQKRLDRLEEYFEGWLVRDIRHADIAQAAITLKPNVKNKTRNREVYAPMAAVLHYAARNDMRDYIVVNKLVEEEAPRRRPAGGVEDKLLAATQGKKRLLVLVLFEQGWRISETLGVTWEASINLRDAVFDLHIPKAKKWKTIAMTDTVHAALAREPVKTGRLFPWETRSGVYKWLWPLCRDLGIRFTPHMARHEFGSALNEQKASAMDIAEAGSWTSPRSTEPYVEVDIERARGLVNRRKRGDKRGVRAAKP